MHINIDADFATLLPLSAAWLFNVQRTNHAMKHVSETSNICVKVSVPSLTLPSIWLPMTPVIADITKRIFEYSAYKEQLRSEIVLSALASAKDLGGELMLEVNGRPSTNTNAKEIKTMDVKVRASSPTPVWWLMSLEMVPWPRDGQGNRIATATNIYDENENGKEEIESFAHPQVTVVMSYCYKMKHNMEPSQGQQHAANGPKNETKTTAYRSEGNAKPPHSFLTVVLGVIVSIFCLHPSSHSDSENEMMPSARPVPDLGRQFQYLPFSSERTQAVWNRPQPDDPKQPFASDTEKPIWSRRKGKGPGYNPPGSDWTMGKSGRKSKGPAPAHPEKTSSLKNRRGAGSQALQTSQQPGDGADQIRKSIPFERRGKGPDPPSSVPERISSSNASAYRLSRTLNESFSTAKVPVEMKKRSEELLQETSTVAWRRGSKAKRLSRISPTKRDTEGLWLDWDEEESRPTPRPGAPAMRRGLASTTVPPSEKKILSEELPQTVDTEGLWLDWNEPESGPIRRNIAPEISSTGEPTRIPSPEADVLDSAPSMKRPPVLEHSTPATSPESRMCLEMMPGSYADMSKDASMDTPPPQFTAVFGSLITPTQQLQVIAPHPSTTRRSIYRRLNARLHGRDVVALRSYPQEGDEYIPYSLERYIFAQIRPPFLHDHNNIVGPRVLAQTRPRGEVQMRRIEVFGSREYDGRVPSITFDEMNLGKLDDVGSSTIED